MSGFFAVKRGITSHPMFKQQPERALVWLWLLDNACWKDTPHDINGNIVTVRRGQVCASERRIAQECGVGYQVVRTFLKRLKAEHMINAEVTHGRNIITLCNYEKYQSPQRKPNAGGNAALTHDQRIKEQDNNIPVGAAPADPSKIIFSQGLALLTSAGKSEGAARGLLGRWKRDHGDGAVIEALGRAQREGAIDPVSFIEGCFRFSKTRSEADRYGIDPATGARMKVIK
ncbi:MAG: hypothetical protein AAFQ05_02860 [Pseudomonadota bacterium]